MFHPLLYGLQVFRSSARSFLIYLGQSASLHAEDTHCGSIQPTITPFRDTTSSVRLSRILSVRVQ